MAIPTEWEIFLSNEWKVFSSSSTDPDFLNSCWEEREGRRVLLERNHQLTKQQFGHKIYAITAMLEKTIYNLLCQRDALPMWRAMCHPQENCCGEEQQKQASEVFGLARVFSCMRRTVALLTEHRSVASACCSHLFDRESIEDKLYKNKLQNPSHSITKKLIKW